MRKPEPKTLTTRQVARILDIGEGMVRYWSEHGDVRLERVDGGWSASSVAAFIADQLDDVVQREERLKAELA